MTEVEVLHTAARRCLWDRVAVLARSRWRQEETAESRLALHTRHDTAEAILEAVESLVPADFSSLAEARSLLALAGQSRPRYIYRPEPDAAVARQAMLDEQEGFLSFLAGLDPATTVEPMPFRRVLTPAEVRKITAALDEAWGAGATEWFPPLKEKARGPAVEIESHGFHEAVSDEALLSILRSHGVTRIYEISEFGQAYQQDLELMQPYYDPERIWFDDSYAWVFFASHEGTIGLGGHWLVEAIRELHPGWSIPQWRQ